MRVRTWASLLSQRQRRWMWLTAIAMLAIVLLGAVLSRSHGPPPSQTFTTAQSIRDIAPPLGVTGKALARELRLPLDVPKKKPLKALGVTDAQLQETVHHIQSHGSSGFKYYLFIALTLGALVFLMKVGRPEKTPAKEKPCGYPRAVYMAFLVTSVLICGFALGKSPNPMEGAVKVFKAAVGLYPDPWNKVLILLLFLLLAAIGNKVICGWVCPFGALQELIHSLPILRRTKQNAKLPFVLTNGIRAVLFVAMLLVLFGVIGNRRGFVLYHYLNPFNLFALEVESISVGMTIILVLAMGVVIYRPFCHLICPFGLLSWVVEKASLSRVRIDHDACIDCGRCAKACPSNAMLERLSKRRMPADCFSCTRCLTVCPVDAITYASPRKGTGRSGVDPDSCPGPEGDDPEHPDPTVP